MTLDPRVVRGLRAQLARRQARLAAGATRIGWKIGINDPRMQRLLGLERPVVGHLQTALVPGRPHVVAGGTRIGVEPEIAIHVGRDVAAGTAPADAAAAIVGLGAALEVVDVDGPLDDLEALVACNSFHRAVLIGPTNPAFAGGTLAGVDFSFTKNGDALATGPAGPAAGDVPGLVGLVADTLAPFGERLLAGDWIISGSLAAPAWVAAGDEVAVDLGPLGRLALDFVA